MATPSDTVGAMKPLRVDPVSLRLLAGRCRSWAADLATPAPSEYGSVPATAAAVATVHSALSATAMALAARMRETADLIDDTARHFQSEDVSAARALGGSAAGHQ